MLYNMLVCFVFTCNQISSSQHTHTYTERHRIRLNVETNATHPRYNPYKFITCKKLKIIFGVDIKKASERANE